MKTFRKLATLALALMLIAALTTTAMAANGGTITVNGESETVYSVYKMFDIERVSGSTNYKYKITAAWEDFAEVSGVSSYFTVTNDYIIWQKNSSTTADAAAMAALASDYVTAKSLTTTKTVAVGSSVTLEEDGYYLLVPNDDSACGVVVVEGGEPVTITEKSTAPGMPVVDKKVKEDSNGTYGDSNTADVGQTIEYQTTITAGQAASKYVVHDAMGAKIAFTDNVTVMHGTNAVAAADYSVITAENDANDVLCDGCTFHIVFSDSLCQSLNNGDTLTVNYTGVLVKDSATGSDHINTTWLTYTEQAVKSNKSSTATQTYKITVNKVDDKNAPLAGAGFVLQDSADMYYHRDETTGAVTWVSSVADATEYITDATGVITFVGIDADNFTLVEKTIPGGYIGAGQTHVSTRSGDFDITVTNTLGQALPETGGVGTTVFYVLGGLLVVGAVVMLFVAKRKEAMQ